MKLIHRLLFAAVAGACTCAAHAAQDVVREQQGNRVSENIPAIPPALLEQLNRYQNTRGAAVSGWTQDGCLLVSTRFAETSQAHRVCEPLGMREQITFYDEPISQTAVAPAASGRDGFVFARDVGGNEFQQLYWYDLKTRGATLLTDGKRSKNDSATFSHDGKLLAYSSTARNGTDTDVWVRDLATGQARPVVTEGGSWEALDFSPDGKQLLVFKGVSAAEAYPGIVDLATGKLRMFPVDGGKAAFGPFKFAPDGKAVYFVSDEPIDGKPSEFLVLRYHDPASGTLKALSADIPWDVTDLEISGDGKHLAFATNEDGIARLHVLALPSHAPVALPELPIGLIGGLRFSPDGKRLAVSLNTATSPTDAYVIDLPDGGAVAKLTRWTRSEVGGLDTARFVAPTLVRFPTFDSVVDGGSDKGRRTIPAFYYRPAKAAAGAKVPVIVNIHGGPESQALPSFSPSIQFLVNELGVAVLVPNVRGSSGYGKTYLTLDNAEKREDSVKDIGALLDWIGQQPELDARRVGVTGGSYGGYMTLASLVHYSDRIRAGIDLVGISDFVTFLNNTESYRRDLRRVEYGDERVPEMRATFERISPLKNAGKIRSPLFVAQGKNDPRVPYTEAEQIAKAVRGNGQPVWFLMFDDEGHGFKKKSNSDYYTAASVLFWQRHLLDKQE
ncbi:S9 family peptidase [Luteimonas aquatica]|uniref:S9 family peptidase n=1 Tax=Luteimonas aquatica TaxID=450364 RepID=UPI001F56EA48|nr:S9 family peptidase [Luteimonas aquatica]